MIPNTFNYLRPNTLGDALTLLAEHGDQARPLAGGHTLLPSMKLRLAAPTTLIDIARLQELQGIATSDREVVIGAATTHSQIEFDPVLAELTPLLPKVAAQIADPSVRNRGTVGGSLANGDPSADWPAAMIAADATFDLASPAGRRSIAADQFFKGLFETELRAGELLVAIRVPVHRHAKVAYRKFRHPASGYAVAAVAAVLTTSGRRCEGARMAVTGLADRARRLVQAESLLAGHELDPVRTTRMLDVAFAELTPLEDGFADAAYRLQLARTMLRRALADAMNA